LHAFNGKNGEKDSHKISDFIKIKPNDPQEMKKALNLGPVLASVQSSSYIFKDFKSGIINDAELCNVGEINHAVLVVGYGTDIASYIISGNKE
jgi:hypothetical protein